MPVDEPAGVPTPRKLRLVLADDHDLVRKGLVELLSFEPDLEVVGEAADGEAAIDLVRRVRPDVLLIDISLPRMDGIEATRRIVAEFPRHCVIGLSIFDDAENEGLMRRAGAVGYATKTASPDALIAVIRACSSRA